MAAAPAHEPLGKHQSKKAATGGWIGSALEYYGFFIYITVTALIFPWIFFPKGDPRTTIIASLATYGVGYIAWPIGTFVLDHLGDIHGRKNALLWCMFLMDFSTITVGLLPTYDQIGLLAPTLLVIMQLIQGLAVADEIPGISSMILEHAPSGRHEFYTSFTPQGMQAGQILTTAVFLPPAHYMPTEQFNTWDWRIPSILGSVVIIVGYVVHREVHEAPTFMAEEGQRARSRSPIVDAFKYSTSNMLRVMCMALMNVIPVVATISNTAYVVQPTYGIDFVKDIYLWIPMVGDIIAVLMIPCVGDLSDHIGRKPPIVIGSLLTGLLAFAYLCAISIKNVPLTFAMSILIWGVVYQGHNAVFPSLYLELFPTRTHVSVMTVSQSIGIAITVMLLAILTAVASPGATNIWLTMGAIAFSVTVVAAAAAISVRETYRVHMGELGQPTAQPVDKTEHARQWAGALAA